MSHRSKSEKLEPGHQPRPRMVVALLYAVVIAGTAVRAVSCTKYVFVDEIYMFYNVLHFFKNHTIIPIHFDYPTLYSYVIALPTAIAAWVMSRIGILPSPHDINGLLIVHSNLSLLPARIVSSFFGVLTIVVVFATGRRFYGPTAGLAAAALIAFSPINVDRSSYGLPDALVVFLAALCLHLSFAALESRSGRHLVMVGLFAGLATSAKYNGVVLVFLAASVFLMLLRDEKRENGTGTRTFGMAVLTGVSFLVAFVMGSPGWVLAPVRFWHGVTFERSLMSSGHLGLFGIPYVQVALNMWRWESLMAVVYALAVTYAIARHSRKDVAALCFVLLSVLWVGSFKVQSLHYLLPMWPAMTVLAAAMFHDCTRAWKHKRVPALAGVLIIVSGFLWTSTVSVQTAGRLVREDNRWAAYRWIQGHIATGSPVIVDWMYVPLLIDEEEAKQLLAGDRRAFFEKRLVNMRFYRLEEMQYDLRWLSRSGGKYLITNDWCYGRFYHSAPPPIGNPLLSEFRARKAAYDYVFDSNNGWEMLRSFHTGPGPVTRVYYRPADIDESRSQRSERASHPMQ